MKMREAVGALGAAGAGNAARRLSVIGRGWSAGDPAGRIAELLKVAPAALSFHLKELSHAGLVSFRQQGRFIYYAADFEQMAALMTFLTQNCCKGMPHECLTVMETALGDCLPGATRRKRTKEKV